VLALEVTSIVHGHEAALASIAAADALFGQGDLAALDAGTLDSAIRALPGAAATSDSLVSQLLVETGLSASLGDARRAIAQGGVYLNNVKVDDESITIGSSVLPGGYAVLRRGKKTLAGIRIS
jgi:tyrosyl-tRNA synthetase